MSETRTKDPNQGAVQLKLVVASAAEAVKTIKERFGEEAKVLSVKQSESGGIARLLQKPRLEVIVEVPRSSIEKRSGSQIANTHLDFGTREIPNAEAETIRPESSMAKEAISNPLAAERKEVSDQKPSESPMSQVPENKSTEPLSKMGYFATAVDEEEAPVSEDPVPEAPLGTAANPVRRGTMENVKKVIAMLQSVGFEDSMIERIRYEIDFRSIGERSTVELYGAVCEWLQNQFPKNRLSISGRRRAFIGSCGAGKTSALCKALSTDVFMSGLEPQVLKLDGDVPNPSDGLETFCEIMGASFHRSWEDVEEHSPEKPLYIDLPGVRFQNESSVEACKEVLDELDVDERVMVLNAAYDSESIAEAMLCGERMGATAVVFTHLDEARKTGKLWRYVLNGRIRPLFFSNGPNPAGDHIQDPFGALLEKTFPHGSSLVRSEVERRSSQPIEEVAAV